MKTDWIESRLGEFLRPTPVPVTVDDGREYRQLTVAMHGRGVRLRQTIAGHEIKTKTQYLARGGQFIYSRIDARNGAMGIIPDDLDGAVVSNDFPVFDIDPKKMDRAFFAYMVQSPAFERVCGKASRGVTNRKRLKEGVLAEITVPVPPSTSEQRRIVGRIDAVAARVAEVRRLQDILDDERDELLFALVDQMQADATWEPMARVAPIVRRPIPVEPGKEYPELGIRSFGKGTFHKDEQDRADSGWKKLYRIEPGDLMISNIKAWEGAIAVAQPCDAGRFGTHRMITCVVDSDRVTPEFLRTYLLTGDGLAAISKASPGTAGRNRTTHLNKLAAIEVPIPDPAALKVFNEVYRRTQQTREHRAAIAAELETLLPAVLDMAFRGEL